jgi:hypothetical protein
MRWTQWTLFPGVYNYLHHNLSFKYNWSSVFVKILRHVKIIFVWAFSLYRIKHRCNCSENHKFSKFRSWKCTWTDPWPKNYNTLIFSDYKRRIFLDLYVIQHCFICHPSDSLYRMMLGLNPGLLRPCLWYPDALTTRLDLTPHSARSHPSYIHSLNFAFNLVTVRRSSFLWLNLWITVQ